MDERLQFVARQLADGGTPGASGISRTKRQVAFDDLEIHADISLVG